MVANPDFIYKPPQTPFLEIVYQDDDLVVLNKPSGLLTVPGRLPEHQDCLERRVQKVLPSATIVHRLDMATSGLLIMALNKDAHVKISRQFETRHINKRYLARVYGKVENESGEVTLPLICDWPNRPKQKVDFEKGKKAHTKYRVLSFEQEATLVELVPVTGRSHQLRVHMLELGHPILGDRLYAHHKALTVSERLQLHAHTLKLSQPTTNETLNFEAPCPF